MPASKNETQQNLFISSNFKLSFLGSGPAVRGTTIQTRRASVCENLVGADGYYIMLIAHGRA
jgi:hypothetical protein